MKLLNKGQPIGLGRWNKNMQNTRSVSKPDSTKQRTSKLRHTEICLFKFNNGNKRNLFKSVHV